MYFITNKKYRYLRSWRLYICDRFGTTVTHLYLRGRVEIQIILHSQPNLGYIGYAKLMFLPASPQFLSVIIGSHRREIG